ncbi:MAG: CxxC-x17-CxxC domain-containing protein [Candidatus Pacearchaeota archaeon]
MEPKRKGFGKKFARQMYKITCSKCGKPGKVPFKPREGMRVLCKSCFFEEKGIKLGGEKEEKQAKIGKEQKEPESEKRS